MLSFFFFSRCCFVAVLKDAWAIHISIMHLLLTFADRTHARWAALISRSTQNIYLHIQPIWFFLSARDTLFWDGIFLIGLKDGFSATTSQLQHWQGGADLLFSLAHEIVLWPTWIDRGGKWQNRHHETARVIQSLYKFIFRHGDSSASAISAEFI